MTNTTIHREIEGLFFCEDENNCRAYFEVTEEGVLFGKYGSYIEKEVKYSPLATKAEIGKGQFKMIKTN